MKAKAPEKIYIRRIWGSLAASQMNITGSDVEYTRTDAFIEKAVSYIQQNWIWNTKIIEDFRNYMKEE